MAGPASLELPPEGLHAGSWRTWNDRVFDAVAIAPLWISIAGATGILALFVGYGIVSGEIARLLSQDVPLWRNRDARLLLLLPLLAAYLPAARHYAVLGVRRSVGDLTPRLALDVPARTRARRGLERLDPRARRLAGALGLCALPLAATLIDRNPSLYFSQGYWNFVRLAHWILGGWTLWHMGCFVYETVASARRLSSLGSLLRVDLLDLTPLAPFARQGLRVALLWLLAVSIFTLNAVDRAFVEIIGFTLIAGMGGALAGLLLPVRGIHERIRREKRDELARLNAAIRGDPGALEGSAIPARANELGLADLLAYREFVASVREWPFDAPTLLRFGLFIAIPLGSWLGGALVERILGAILD